MVVSEIEFQLRSADASWCYAKWEQLPDDGNRYEVIDGVLYMSTAPSFWHQRTIQRLDRSVGASLESQDIAIAVTAPIGLIMPGADPVQPDFMLIRSERRHVIAEDGRVRGVPDLIAEVLSPSHPELDTVVKRAAYARAGVPEYWMPRPETRDILVCSEPDAALSDFTNVRRFTAGSELVSPTLSITIAVAALFEDAALSIAPAE
ncbi:MAG: Uma2 family endonuclease [Vicinamibacterales bacterium]